MLPMIGKCMDRSNITHFFREHTTRYVIDIRIKQCTTKQGTTHHCTDWCFLHVWVQEYIYMDDWAGHTKRQPSILIFLWVHFSANIFFCLICFVLSSFKQTIGTLQVVKSQKWFIMIFHHSKTCNKEDRPNFPSRGLPPPESWYKQPAANGGVAPTNEDPDYHSESWWFRTPVNHLSLVVYLTIYDRCLATSQVLSRISESWAVPIDSRNSQKIKSLVNSCKQWVHSPLLRVPLFREV